MKTASTRSHGQPLDSGRIITDLGRLRGPSQHTALLQVPDAYDCLLSKDNLLDEGVHAVFGVRDGDAELLAVYFAASRFTLAGARAWLHERRFEPMAFAEATD